jgi:hypothetical protein
MIVYIAFRGWRGDYEPLGVYESKDAADAMAASYNSETGYHPDSGNAASVVGYPVITDKPLPEPK